MKKSHWIAVAVIVLAQVVVGFSTAGGKSARPNAPREAGPATMGRAAGSELASKVIRIGFNYPIQAVKYTALEPCGTCRFFNVSSSGWKTLANSDIPIKVEHDGALLFARFTAESWCGNGSGVCGARIKVRYPNGTTRLMEPSVGLTWSFDSSDPGAYDEEFETHSIEQVLPVNVHRGVYHIFVETITQKFTGSPQAPTFKLDGWTFTAQAAWDPT